MRRTALPACLAAVLAAAPMPARGETVVRDLAASFTYGIRDRVADRDGSWFATYALSGEALPIGPAEGPLALSCIGSAWGFGVALSGERAICRLAHGADLLFARAIAVQGTAGETSLQMELEGGRGVFSGYAGRASIERVMDLGGAPPDGRGSMTLRLVLMPAINEGE